MEEKYNKIRSLQEDIQKLFKLVDSKKQIIDVNKLIVLDKMLAIFKKNEKSIVDDLFTVNSTQSEDDTIKRLESLKTILQIILEIETNIKETSSTGGGGSFTPGEGEQYATKFAFKKPVYGYKLAKKQTNETKSNDDTFINSLNITDPALKLHVEKRLKGFDDVETKLNELVPLLKQAKQKTLEIYQKNPNFDVIYSTDIAADYLQDIITLFKD